MHAVKVESYREVYRNGGYRPEKMTSTPRAPVINPAENPVTGCDLVFII